MGDLRGLPVFHQRTGHTCDLGVKYSDSWQAGPSWHSNWWVETWTEVDTIKLLPISPRRKKVSGLFKTIQKEYIWKEFCGCMSAATMQPCNWRRCTLRRRIETSFYAQCNSTCRNMPFWESFPKKSLCDFKLVAVDLCSLCIKWCMTFTIQETLFHVLDLLRSIHSTRRFGKLHHHAGRIWLWFKHCQNELRFGYDSTSLQILLFWVWSLLNHKPSPTAPDWNKFWPNSWRTAELEA